MGVRVRVSCAKRITDAGGGAGGNSRTICSPHLGEMYGRCRGDIGEV